ncbi:MAG: hypothetical protein V8T85_13940 [Blautia faecicola]
MALGMALRVRLIFLDYTEYSQKIRKHKAYHYSRFFIMKLFPCCHAADESTIFFEFIRLRIDKILDDISDQISEKNEYLSEPVQKKSSSTGD